MADHDRQVLIAAEMDAPDPPDFLEGAVPAGLRPGIGIEVREQPVAVGSMQMDRAAESRLRQHGFHDRSGPVLAPRVQEAELPFAEQLQSRKIDTLRVVGGIVDVIGPRTQLRDLAGGTGLELAVLEDREIKPANPQPGEVNPDAPLHRRRIRRVGQVPGLLALHHVDVGDRIEVSAVGIALQGGAVAAFAPEIGVPDIVVVGNADRRPVAHQLPELQPELDPAGCVLGMPIRLIPGEEEQVGILREQARDDLGPQPRGPAGVAGHRRHDDLILVARVAPDGAGKLRGGTVAHAVARGPGAIPVGHPEMGAPARIDHCRTGDLGPGSATLDFEPGLARFVRTKRIKLGGQLEYAGILGVERKGHDLIAGHVHRRRRVLVRRGPGPPIARSERIEIGKVGAEGSGGLGRR